MIRFENFKLVNKKLLNHFENVMLVENTHKLLKYCNTNETLTHSRMTRILELNLTLHH
jgi:hypothetical protein